MTKPNTGELDPQDSAGSEIKSYAIGFTASLLLTVGAFAAAMSDLPLRLKIACICAAAILQIVVHMRFFLHVDLTRQKREDLQLILFTVLLLVLMAGGTIWLMTDLAARMH